ncbi:LacI family DNA-binding transcriptional regulator [Echinicola vietnamensis]|uniref:Transcriptional regulator n=1 Tax=Echinicola vietnamensis (strain DSM 17526 / LMG 23754 / KMM 6221) TaxID=926556 RepID=L0FW51_ECHVK|nr:LacI family DNA-binding transcriptional regulator [Echinicola vietnamensis]AGA78119.1 transcriptional regulator [Echinicola vietnamensis DSM 17526]
MNKDITIYDIAKNLGVSPTTVSRALNDHPAVNPKTKKRIFDAADQMGYQSNVFASNLRSKRTNNIGIIVPRLNSSFQSSVLAGMEKVANEAGYNLIISQSLESYEKEKANARSMFNSRVDGLLVSLAGDTDKTKHFQPFMDKGTPILFFDRVASQSGHTGVVIDNSQAGYNATQHLIQQGCKNIIHVLGNLKINVYGERLKGYKYALMDHDIPFTQENILHSDLNEEAGEDIAHKILSMDPLPDGLFVSNDACAASCIRSLKQAGIKIPEDIAVVGFNNDMISRLIEPNLTTTHYPGYEMGEVAMKNLINHLTDNTEGVLHNTNTITLRSELIIRASSLKKKLEP